MRSSWFDFQGLLWPGPKVLSIHPLNLAYLDALVIYIVPGLFHPQCQMPVVQILCIVYDSCNVKPLQNLTFLVDCNLSVAPYLHFLYDNSRGQLATEIAYMPVFFFLLEKLLKTNFLSL